MTVQLDQDYERASLEDKFAELLTARDIKFNRPEREGGRLDFYLPQFGLFVEIKTWPCERLLGQIESADGRDVLVLIGPTAVKAFGDLLKAAYGGAVNRNVEAS